MLYKSKLAALHSMTLAQLKAAAVPEAEQVQLAAQQPGDPTPSGHCSGVNMSASARACVAR